MVSEDDFIEDESPDKPSEYLPDPIHVQFFLNYVKLCEIMGLVLSQQYSVASKLRRNNAIDLTHSDMALADWLQNCPPEVRWEPPRHHFWSALLQANYYTTLCLLHRAHMPPAGSPESRPPNGYPEETAYPSRTIAYQAAGMITSIIETLQAHDQLRYTPAFMLAPTSHVDKYDVLTWRTQCLLSLFCAHHACLSDEVKQPIHRISNATKTTKLYECITRCEQGVVGGEDGSHAL